LSELKRDDPTGRAVISAMVERIISVESGGDPNAKASDPAVH
jgi:hypothetical protein